MEPIERVAIVGIGGRFAGSPDPARFWANIAAAVDATGEPPPGRWLLDPAQAYGPNPGAADRVSSTRGGFIDGFALDFDGLDLDPDLLERLDPAFHLALHAGRQAWRDAVTEPLDKGRVGVILGNIVLPTEGASALARAYLGRTFEEKLGLADEEAEATEPLNAYAAGLPAGLLAKALRLGGGSFTLDAACASSLYALKLAADELLAGRADAMLTGGLSRPDSLYTQMGFSQLRALSARGRAAPFDAAADGLVVGEGAGVFVLKRLSDALRHGDSIYGVVAAVGLSNDVDGGLLAPSSEGQLRAMRAAYEHAGWDPREVDLIECHATGTPVGDAVEFESLRTLWGTDGWTPGRCTIGSVKSNVGHALTAAGSAGLLKVLLALKHETLPPTANFDTPAPSLGYEGSPFRVLGRSAPWEGRAGRPRRAAISGFGFGGINAHALIEQWIPRPALDSRGETAAAATHEQLKRTESPTPIAVVGMSAHFGPFAGLEAFRERVLGGADDFGPVSPRRRWGVEQSDWLRAEGQRPTDFQGYPIERLFLEADRFRIPPKELVEMLPQQSLMLGVAADAAADARWDDRPRLRAGVFVGIGLDLNTTNFHLRWSVLARAREWAERLGLALSEEELARWTAALRDAAGPPLTANRTMGSLGGLIASRIAREFRIGGPSFTVSSEETSGLRALDVAVKLLRKGEVDEAVVGAVDFPTDVRAVLSAQRLNQASPSGPTCPSERDSAAAVYADGAAALVVKRLDDALRDGDRVYAVIRGVGAWRAGGIENELPEGEAAVGYLDLSARAHNERSRGASRASPAPDPSGCAIGSARGDLGHAGAASALASLVKAILCLGESVLPPLRGAEGGTVRESSAADGAYYAPRAPQYWLHDRAEGPRRAAVGAVGLDGNGLLAVLEAPAPPSRSSRHVQPLGARPTALFAIEGKERGDLLRGLEGLEHLSSEAPESHVEKLARQWWGEHPNDPRRAMGLAVVADSVPTLRRRLSIARARLQGSTSRARDEPTGIYCSAFEGETTALGVGGRVAFVYPGLGNHFAGMGRELSAHWPEILRAQEAENQFLRSQLGPGTFWNSNPPEVFADHRAPILGQVALGTVVTDLLSAFGVHPDAAIGYSLGETSALFALRAWRDRDGMLRRLNESPLFRAELSGPCEAARRAWALPPGEAVRWTAGVVPVPAEQVKAVLAGKLRAYLLIVNTPAECVIGGHREAVASVVDELRCAFVPLPLVSTVHCEVAREVEADYRALHGLPTTSPPGVRFYGGAWGRSYDLDRQSAAEAIVAQATGTVDFHRLIEQAHADGVRVFVEVGPGSSCTRMIQTILRGRPHLARPACVAGQNEVASVLDLLGRLIAERVPVDLGYAYRQSAGTTPVAVPSRGSDDRTLTIDVGGQAFRVPPLPRTAPREHQVIGDAYGQPNGAEPRELGVSHASTLLASTALSTLSRQVLATENAKAEAHEAFLRCMAGYSQTQSNQLAFQMALIESLMSAAASRTQVLPRLGSDPPLFLDRAGCLEFAVGSVGAVLGPEFASVDEHPTRVRLPDEPLMLVDRILTVEGEPRGLGSGRVVTEHDVLADAWYLDGGRIAPCIAIESGQADLFLSGYLGIDFVTKGLAVYRLLDATVTFHRGLPGPGAVIRYDIHIDRFFRQGDTHLFRFRFEGTVDGEPILTMRDGCAGFFSAHELAAGKGIVRTQLGLTEPARAKPDEWEEWVPLAVEAYDELRVDALRRGDLAAAFGDAFNGLELRDPVRLPGGRMTLIHRVARLDPHGGRYGFGSIRAEADIRPDDWYLTCHFVDDQVMPGTLMYECCLHTLRIYLMRMGWLAESASAVWEPVPGVASRLKCRGQVTGLSRTASYEISIKRLGYGPEPYAIVDAVMYADGKPIVEITDMSLRLTGQTREGLRALWRSRSQRQSDPPVVFTREQVLAFAVGKPSEAFGAPYRVFDEGRFIARLPGPPYLFLDRITAVRAQPWRMAAGGEAEAQYDVPPDAWYFAADRQDQMPLAALMEVPLQACGWLAAYVGSALTSEHPLKFRNLGGSATRLGPVTTRSATLTTLVRITKVSQSAGMIIQHYEFETRTAGAPVYRGDTYFGFFREEALAEQVGLRDVSAYRPGPDESARARRFAYPEGAPFPDGSWRMIDRIDAFDPTGGPNRLGWLEGSKWVDPSAWYFKAHFYQDPVCPGSLGLESLQQLLKVLAADRWGVTGESAFASPETHVTHRWSYRGQVIPTDRLVTTQALVTEVDDRLRRLKADGSVTVDGRLIYQMNDFSLGLGGGPR
jgi:PfaB family protein